MKALISLAASAALLACAHAPKKPRSANPTVEAFTRFSKFGGARLSPHGKYLALLSHEGGLASLVFVDLRTRKLASVFKPERQSVAGFTWVSDDRIIVALAEDFGTLAAPSLTGELTAVNPATGNGVTLFGARAFRNAQYKYGFVLSRLRGDERHVMIETSSPGERFAQIYKLDVDSGTTTPVTISPIEGADFFTDETGEARVAAATDAGANLKYFFREPGAAWSELGTLKGVGARSDPIGFVSWMRTLEFSEPMEKGFGVFAVNVDTGARKLVSRNDWSPPTALLRDFATRQLLAIEYDADVPTWDFVAPEHPLAKVLRGLLDAYPGENVRILTATDDEKTVVAIVYSDRDPGRFLLLDADSMQAEEIAASRPWIKPDAMAETSAFHIKASDGFWIHGYLTLPPALKEGAAAPMVVIPHGGPHGPRDFWTFDSEVQLLASQGFAVLQVNFRGSGGYGRKFQEAGYRHWGDRIMLDIADATRWVVSKGRADPERICIYGGSFGGYSALQAPIVAPDLFRCAVGYAGVYDLTLIGQRALHEDDTSESYIGRGVVQRYLGDDEAELKRNSPSFHADRIKARVLLIHGVKDRRAPYEHFRRMKKALEEAGNPPETLVEPDEGHGFYDEDARERMYTKLLDFLRENLSAGTAPSTAASTGR